MACLFTDAVGIAERGDRVAATHRLLDKFFAYSHEIGSPPRHSSLQGCVPTKVSRNNASTYLCSRSRTYPSSRSVPGFQLKLLSPDSVVDRQWLLVLSPQSVSRQTDPSR